MAENILRAILLFMITTSLGGAALLVFQAFFSGVTNFVLSASLVVLCGCILKKTKPNPSEATVSMTLLLLGIIAMTDSSTKNILESVRQKYGTTAPISLPEKPKENVDQNDLCDLLPKFSPSAGRVLLS